VIARDKYSALSRKPGGFETSEKVGLKRRIQLFLGTSGNQVARKDEIQVAVCLDLCLQVFKETSKYQPMALFAQVKVVKVRQVQKCRHVSPLRTPLF